LDAEWAVFLWLSKRFFWCFFQREKYMKALQGAKPERILLKDFSWNCPISLAFFSLLWYN
jgi:hypothetical protein